jgi:hypothetical protein
VDSAFCKGSITKESGRAQSDRFYKRKWHPLGGHKFSDFVCPGGGGRGGWGRCLLTFVFILFLSYHQQRCISGTNVGGDGGFSEMEGLSVWIRSAVRGHLVKLSYTSS